MGDGRINETTRSVIDEFDRRLRDAERLRNHATNRERVVIWPDRRRISRTPDIHHDDSSDDTGRAR
jgi:hypothetical protein